LTNPPNGTTSSLQAIQKTFRGRTPIFPAGKVFGATLARIAKLALSCAPLCGWRAEPPMGGKLVIKKICRLYMVLREEAFRVVTVLRVTG
ncbi:uncharacterized protein PgNI_02580, partial [Pyricularia grisea]|uniref:Uncharacterized protein n=1 Tax=Pyricularia grisea TaxID=148305 RepID=A0A6P8BL63_PYRGI